MRKCCHVDSFSLVCKMLISFNYGYETRSGLQTFGGQSFDEGEI